MKSTSGWRLPKLDFSWLRQKVSWQALIATAAIFGLLAGIFVVAGGVDISADQPDGWIARHLLHFVSNAVSQHIRPM